MHIKSEEYFKILRRLFQFTMYLNFGHTKPGFTAYRVSPWAGKNRQSNSTVLFTILHA